MTILKSDLRHVLTVRDRFERRPVFVYGLLAVFGLITAYLLISPWNFLSRDQLEGINGVYMSSRTGTLNGAMRSIENNGYVSILGISGSNHNAPFYLYAAYLGVLSGKTEAMLAFLFIQMGAAAFLLAAYPSMIYRLTDSLAAALCSPLLVSLFVGQILYKVKGDVDYGLAWVLVMCLPLLGIYCREKKGAGKWIVFGALCLFMGIGNLWRAHGSLPILLLLAAVIVVEQRRRWKRHKSSGGGISHRARLKIIAAGTALILVCVTSYELFTYIIPNIYAVATGQGFVGKFSFGPWHSLYLGLGWEENKYGILALDQYGVDLAKSIDPEAIYPNARYMEVMRHEWFSLWREDPGYMLGTYCRKLLTCFRNSFHYSFTGSDPGLVFSSYRFVAEDAGFAGGRCILIFAAFTALLRYCFGRREIFKPYVPVLIFTAVSMVVAMDMPMISRPSFAGYIFGTYGACSMFFLFAALALVSAAEKALAAFAERAA